jgi:hypothetical protein
LAHSEHQPAHADPAAHVFVDGVGDPLDHCFLHDTSTYTPSVGGVSFGLETLAEPSADILPIERAARDSVHLGTVNDLASDEFSRVRRSYLRLQIAAKAYAIASTSAAQMLHFAASDDWA